MINNVEVMDGIRALLLLVVGSFSIWIISRILKKYIEKHLSKHVSVLVNHLSFYGGMTLLLLMVLTQLGFHVTALLGAAGIVGVAVGFASQTTLSNVISGIFILMEGDFTPGDLMELSGARGYIQSIDLLSIRLKTVDGRLIRIPNEHLIKNISQNATYYSLRRLTFFMTVKSGQSFEAVAKQIDALITTQKLYADKQPKNVYVNEGYPWGYKVAIQYWVDARQTTAAAAQFLESCSSTFDKDLYYVYQESV